MFNFFEDLGRSSVEFFGQNALFVEFKTTEHMAKITVNHIFHGSVNASEHNMVTTTQRL